MDKAEEDAKLLVAFCHKNYCWQRVKEILKCKGVVNLKDLIEHIEKNCYFEMLTCSGGQEFFQNTISFWQWASTSEGFDYWAYISFCWRMTYAIHYKTKEAHDNFIKKVKYLVEFSAYDKALRDKIKEKFKEFKYYTLDEKSNINC